MNDEPTWKCVRIMMGRMRTREIIGADEVVRRDAAELHPGADRELVRGYFTFKPTQG